MRWLAVLVVLFGCKRTKVYDDVDPTVGSGSEEVTSVAPTPARDIDSKDILARTRVAGSVSVKHILLAWKDLEPFYKKAGMPIDPRAKTRTNEEAARLAEDFKMKLTADPQKIHSLAKQFSEDQAMAQLDEPYTLGPEEKQLMPAFVRLATRLERGETGIVRTDYGYHVITRLAAVRDPVESAAILDRKEVADDVWVREILVGWKDTQAVKQGRRADPRAATRTRDDAAKLATELLGKVATGDIVALMKEYSEDRASNATGAAYEVTPASAMVEGFVELSVRLQPGEAGIVQSPFGFHVVKRVEQPPLDPLESKDILARAPTGQRAKIKVIMMGWKDANVGDPKAAARTREELEKRVAEARARLGKGESIDQVMRDLSDDKSVGKAIEVTPSAGLVPGIYRLAVRLAPSEVGLVKTNMGIHIVKRIE